jgi:hypothetical protein
LFWTGVVTVLAVIYMHLQPLVQKAIETRYPPSDVMFTIDEEAEEQCVDGTPSLPDAKSNIRVDTIDMKQMYVDVYSLGIGSFFLLYSVQSSNGFGNAIFSLSFFLASSLAFFREHVHKRCVDNPLTSRVRLLLDAAKSDYHIFALMPFLLILHVICTLMLLVHTSSQGLEQGWYGALNGIISLISPWMIANRTFPRGTTETLKMSMPVSAMMGVCCISMAMSTASERCAWGFFYQPEDAASILWYRVIMTGILPVPAILVVHSLVGTCNNGGIIDTATILLAMASARLYKDILAPTILSGVALGVLVGYRLYCKCVALKNQ